MIAFAVRRPVTVLMASIGLCLLGALSWQRLPVQLIPQIVFPEVQINIASPDAFAEELEREAALPVEAEVATVPGVREINTQIFGNAANLTVVFEQNTDMKFALIKIQQKMNAVQSRLPQGTRITLDRFDTADLATALMQVDVRGDMSVDDLREVAERRIRPRLEQVDGVVSVLVGGGRRSAVDIVIDPDRCEALGIPMERVREKINAYHRQRSSVGRLMADGRWIDVSVDGRIDDLAELRDLIIEPKVPVRLEQLGAVFYSAAERVELYRVNGKASVGVFLRKDHLSNMLAVSDGALEEIERLNRELAPEGVELAVGFNQAALVRSAIDQLEWHALSGLALTVLVLFLFLRSLRFVLILAIAIPVSLLITFNFMYAWDLSVNILSLCGLALSVGMLVDNGIVVLENVFRRFRHTTDTRAAAVTGSAEMSRSIFAATASTILVFLPVLFVESQARLVVRELALSVIFPLIVSLVVAMTIVPLLAGRITRERAMQTFGGGRLLEIYRILLKAALRRRAHVLIAIACLFGLSLVAGTAFILSRSAAPPPARLDVYVTATRGATLDATDQMTRRVEEYIAEFPNVKEYRSNIRAEEAQISIEFIEASERDTPLDLNRIKDQLIRINDRLSGVTVGFEPPLSRGGRSGGDNLSGLLSTERALRLRGYDIGLLRQFSEQLAQTLGTIPEVDRRSIRSDLRPGSPEIQIRGDRERLARAGMTMTSLMALIPGTRPEGLRAGTPFVTSQGEVDIRILPLDMEKRQPQDLETLRLQTPDGQTVFLREVADVRQDVGQSNIVRFNQERHVEVHYDFTEQVRQSQTLLDRAEAQISQVVASFRVPEGFILEPVEPEDQKTVYYWMFGIGALLIYMLLAAQFESLLSPLVILGAVPTAIIGAIWALMLSDTPLSLGEGAPMALLGFIVLLGIVVNNGIILVDRIAVLRHQNGYRWQRAALTASQQRVRPIMMTSVTTILGVLPLSVKQGVELELWPPFAITILGGLSVSTFSTLIFIPALYVGLEQTRAWMRRIGTVGLVLATAATLLELFWLYQQYPGKLYIGLLSLPVWFINLGFAHILKQRWVIRQEKARSAERIDRIQIRNLTKIYGLPASLRRDWNKERRRRAIALEKGILPWTAAGLKSAGLWMGAGTGLLVWLHTLVESPPWTIILALLSLAWLFGVRELWYAFRFVKGWPPVRKTPGAWRQWLRLRRGKASGASEEAVPATPMDFPRSGGLLFILLFVGFLQLRIQVPGFTIAVAFLSLALYQLHRIGRRIEQGRIDPEHPVGRLRRMKRFVYSLVRALPVIRPAETQITALNGVSLEIGSGMLGLLGPNGAGKTTLMRILVGVLEQNRGSVYINGKKLDHNREIFHGAIGYLPQGFGLYETMTPYAFLENHALINGIYETGVRTRLIEETLKGVGLWDRRHDRISAFSGGMKQRVGIAQTLLHLPQIIVVDEPTVGLDPRERIRFRNLLAELAKERIVVFSTHIVEDVASTCRDLAVLFGGELLYRGSPEQLIHRAAGKVYETTVQEEQFEAWRQRLHVVNHIKIEEGIRMRFVAGTPEEGCIQENGAVSAPPNLEDAYVYLLREKQRQDARS